LEGLGTLTEKANTLRDVSMEARGEVSAVDAVRGVRRGLLGDMDGDPANTRIVAGISPGEQIEKSALCGVRRAVDAKHSIGALADLATEARDRVLDFFAGAIRTH
jgi:hypothetical protein